MQHPAYVAFMNDPKNANLLAKSPQMARDMASMQARTAIAKDPTSVPPSDDQLRRAASSTDTDAAASARNVIAQQQKDATAKVPGNPVPMPVAQKDPTAPKAVPMPAPPATATTQNKPPAVAPEKETKENIFSLNSVVDELLNRK
jgi:hypothetical protein